MEFPDGGSSVVPELFTVNDSSSIDSSNSNIVIDLYRSCQKKKFIYIQCIFDLRPRDAIL